MNIDIIDDKIVDEFSKGDIVFKIEAAPNIEEERRPVGMVNTKEDYEKRLRTHFYDPILFVCRLPLRLAYLYGCLNHSFNAHQTDYFYFSWRRLRETVWNDWFIVHPYTESIHGDSIRLL